MGMFSKDEMKVTEEYEGYVNNEQITIVPTVSKPNFKGEAPQTEIKFPVELGIEHPFNFSATEGIYKKFGMANGVVDKYIDFIMAGGFYVKVDNEEADETIKKFFKNVNFDTILRQWLKEALTKNGFLEIGGKKDEAPQGLKVLDAKYMYVDRDSKGVVEGYNQWIGGFKKFNKKQVQTFKPYQIAHLKLNTIGNDAYGLGIIYPAMKNIDNMLATQKDIHTINRKKANSPYHIKLGGVVGGKYYKPSAATVEKWGGDLEWLTNKNEWVTDGLTDIKVIDFGNLGDKFDTILKNDNEQLFYTWQVPAVLMGIANVNEGVANTQMEGFRMRISSLQQEVEKVIEDDILRRVLDANGFEDVEVEFEWGVPSESEKNERMLKITTLLQSPMTSNTLKALVERDLIKMLGYDEDAYEKAKALEDVQKEKEKQEDRTMMKQAANSTPAVPGVPSKPKFKAKAGRQCYESVCGHCTEEAADKYESIVAWLGFDYKKYKTSIDEFLREYGFGFLAATNTLEETAGMLSKPQVMELRKVLKNGFDKGKGISAISKDITEKVKPKDLLKMENGVIIKDGGVPKVTAYKENRAKAIARTEITRAANEGALKEYKKGGIEKVRWIAAADRTCPICEGFDNQVYKIGDHPSIPQHVMCRCALSAVTSLD